MVNINSEVIVERIQKDGVNTIIITAVIAILSWIFNMYHKSASIVTKKTNNFVKQELHLNRL